jgi:hypothetical protein
VISSINNIHQLVFVNATQRVFCDVGTAFLSIVCASKGNSRCVACMHVCFDVVQMLPECSPNTGVSLYSYTQSSVFLPRG